MPEKWQHSYGLMLPQCSISNMISFHQAERGFDGEPGKQGEAVSKTNDDTVLF